MIVQWVELEEMKKKQELKKGSFHIEMNLGNGIQKIKDQNLWNLFNGKKKMGEHFRIFPISNWTEMDVWQYIYMKKLNYLPYISLTKEI